MTVSGSILTVSPTQASQVGTHTVKVGKAVLINPAEENRSYSSNWNGASPGDLYASSQIDSSSGWVVATNDANQWMIIDVGEQV
jgi:hypothetical protein